MGGRGAWRDNVVIEHFWWTPKHEEAYLRVYNTVRRPARNRRLHQLINAECYHSSLQDRTTEVAYRLAFDSP